MRLGRGVGSIAIKPGDSNTIYATSAQALLGASSVFCGGVTLIPGAAIWGLYKSTNGGTNWTLIHNGAASVAGCTNPSLVAGNATPCSPRGVRRVALDPTNPNVVYAGSYARGIWRSPDNGATWTQIFSPIAAGPATGFTERPEFAITTLPSAKTRMYVYIGRIQAPPSALYRSDDVATGSPLSTALTSSNPANDGYGSFNLCTGQCWYDNLVFRPPGYPDIVYLGGSYLYNESGRISNGRGVVLSTNAGQSFTDVTMDATDALHPNGIHPDQHAMVVNPNNPFPFFEAGDGGVVRSSGGIADVSSLCDSRGISGAALARCKQLLSRVPTELESINKGLTTLQFQSLSVNPANVNNIQGGTQDNGTWETTGNPVKWVSR